jgi:uncharacterized metal-binding protein
MNKQDGQESCTSGDARNVVFACSGASDVGEITDLAARKLAAEGGATMLGLAGISGGVSATIAGAKAAPARLAIDGCPVDCARKVLEQADLGKFEHLRLSDLGMERGESPVTDARIRTVVDCAKTRWAAEL